MYETASVAGGNFGAIRETDEVVVAVRPELAVEQFSSGDFERLNELPGLDECFFSRKEEERETLTSHTTTKSPSWTSLFLDHIFRACCCRGVSDYSTRSKRKKASCKSQSRARAREIRFLGIPNQICRNLAKTSSALFCIRANSQAKNSTLFSSCGQGQMRGGSRTSGNNKW